MILKILVLAEVFALRYNSTMNNTAFSKLLMLELLLLLAFLLPPLVESLPQLFGGLDGTMQGHDQRQILERAVNPSVFSILFQGLFVFAMLLRSKELDLIVGKAPARSDIEKKPSNFSSQLILHWLLPFFLVFGLLLANSFLWNGLAQATGKIAIADTTLQLQSLPLMIFATAVAALYEELLYRWYSPMLLNLAFSWKLGFQGKTACLHKNPPLRWIFVEGLLVIIFALSHGYGGWLAVANALVAGSILRLCVMYTKKPWVGFFSHLAYNLIQFALLLKS
ncbi:MAG: CPBP family intramembrane metalloprotease [Spirochaetaceae bacterium]|nr:CPBP family intramembrane metalloprotease [Spirochaetaceae bacterium]